MPVPRSFQSPLSPRLLTIFLAFLISAPLLAGCQSTRTAAVRRIPPDVMRTDAAQSRVHSIMRTAFSQVGNPYRYGGNSPETGFDCSGFVGWVYKQYGVDLPRSSRDMMAVGTPISRAELRPGDLVFFNYGYSHVGIYTGDDKYIHSPSTGKRIQESDLNAKGRGDHFVAARRVIDNKGVTAVSERLKSEWVQASRHSTALAMSDSAARRHTGAAAYRGTRNTAAKKASASRTAGGKSRTVSAKAAQSHKVASGDTLVDVAKRYGVSATDLAAYNGIADVRRIQPGQAIKIPPKTAAASTKAKASGKAKASAKGKSKGKAAAKGGAKKK
ncbi:MAG: C40 family peptidase [Deltaproteobacteria bacterium]|jgi:LysM repeat protein|nr:C40 family peptidase [Deltaproteobacteria bacterium]